MIRTLHHRLTADRFPNEVRGRSGGLARWIYMASLLAMAAWLADLFLAPLVRLEADGMVVAEQVSVSAPFPARVAAVHATPGAPVRRGEIVARVQSLSAVDSIAQLTARISALAERRAVLAARVQVAATVLAAARERASEAEAAVEALRPMRERGTVNAALWAETLRERAAAGQALATLEAESSAAAAELPELDGVLRQTEAALAALREAYGDGAVLAPADGTAGPEVAHAGAVLTVGQPILEVYGPQRHVLAWMTGSALHQPAVGQEVEVSSGARTVRGRIVELRPLADRLPTEFQKSFHPAGRGQVLRIALDDESAFPLFAKVQVHALWRDALAGLLGGR